MEMDAPPAPLPVMDDARLARPTFVPPVVAIAAPAPSPTPAPAPSPTPAVRPQSLTLTLAEIDDIKGRDGRRRLQFWIKAVKAGQKSKDGDRERRANLKRKLGELGGTFTVSDAAMLDKYPWP